MYTECNVRYVCSEDSRKTHIKPPVQTAQADSIGIQKKRCVWDWAVGLSFPFFFLFPFHTPTRASVLKSSACAWDKIFL